MEFRFSNEQIEGNTSDKILHFIRKEDSITILELADKIGVNEKTIRRTLIELQNKGEIIRTGSDKSGKWKITKMSV